MGRKPSCVCGECGVCKNREYQQEWQAKKKRELQDSLLDDHRETSVVKRKRKKLEEVLTSKVPIVSEKGNKLPMALMIQDHTRIGLKINVFRDGRSVCVSVSLPERESNIERIPMDAIRVRKIRNKESEAL